MLAFVPMATVLAALVLAPRADADRGRGTPASAWATIIEHPEVRVEMDVAHLGAGPIVGVWLRWTFADRAASPRAWDAGVRSTLDVAEVRCGAGATRTLASTGYTEAGEVVTAATFSDAAAVWHAPGDGSVGREVAAAVCRMTARRSAGERRA